jgi:hypothetical protein
MQLLLIHSWKNLNYFFSLHPFLHGFDRKKVHWMLVFMLDPRFLNVSSHIICWLRECNELISC